MKIVINAASTKMGGAVTYITNVLRCLCSVENDLQFLVFLPKETAAGLPGLGPNIRILSTEIGHANALRRMWWDQFTLRRFLRKEGVSVLFSAGNFAMFRCPVRQLLLIRNALYFSEIQLRLFLPRHSLRSRLAFRLRRWLMCRSARWANIVMTPTQAMLDELRHFVAVAPGKALVNPYGGFPAALVFPEGRDEIPAARRPSDSAVRLVYVSLYSEHKNLSTLLKAMPLLNGDGGRRFRLLTTVDPGWEGATWTVTHKEELTLARQPDVAPWVRFVPPPSNGGVRQLYGEGDIFVFPSVCESFGHPMVEAMAHGLPIVAADTPVNREICGKAALYFRPLDPEDFAEKVALLGRNQALREKLGAVGRGRAATRFRWEDHVERLLRAFGLKAGAAVEQHLAASCAKDGGCLSVGAWRQG